MKILYHHRTQAEDAQGVHIHEMVRAFEALGHTVRMQALVELDRESRRKVRGAGWKRIAGGAPAWLYELMGLIYNLHGYRGLARAIRKSRPDLIYERYALNTFCGVWASRRFGIPLVLEVNAPLRREQRALGRLAFRRLARFSERWICSNSTRTIVVTDVMRRMLVEEGVRPERLTVMHNGVDPSEFHPGVSGEAVRRRHGLDGKTVVGFVGWFRPWHGLEMLLDAVRGLAHEGSGVRLLLVGDGPACADLRRQADTEELRSRVVFTGPVPREEIPHHVAAMDVAVQPSATAYACPLKLIEYMALGRCVVGPDQENVHEILEHGADGLLFRAGDAGALREALSAAVRDGELRARLGHAAAATVARRGLHWTGNARRTLELIFGEAADEAPARLDPAGGAAGVE
jgi:glycosyltransferase involved in cell wall biosynthesis